ncbi:MAG: hypothetical protein HON53_16915 [Planctomycetaceae bacterium]|jgi:hypothetical protein|nr:hypothetical protein [Planctomycetaceae bacterium]MBT6157187.1 hypothetical protein [Planctomycetaceae bacterium]MBT6486968.1 hypothetical protein [Planctomycetaceae bacterium]MBT6493000.1 hypothetical protein [Planctomycetaceae bacterium]
MPIEFDCHVCGRLLRTSEDKAGRTAKCPGCGEAVAVPVPVEEPAEEFVAEEPAAEESDENVAAEDVTPEEDGTDNINGTDDTGSAHDHGASENAPVAVSRRTRGSKICPVCGETIKAVAIRCRYCGEDVAEVEQLPQTLEFGEVFSASWKLFSDDLGLHIGAMFIVGVITLVVVGIGVVFGLVAIAAVTNGGGDPGLAVVVLIVVVPVVLLVAAAVQAYLAAGYNIFLLKSVRGERPEISDLFSGGPYFLRMLANHIVFNLLVMVGLLMCYVPGILLILMLWSYSFVVVDENRPGLEPLRRAKDLMEGNWGAVFVLMLVAGLIYSGASFIPFGGLFVLPWMMVMQAIIYCRLTGQRTAE